MTQKLENYDTKDLPLLWEVTLSVGFSKQEYWSALPHPPSSLLSPALRAGSLPLAPPENPI